MSYNELELHEDTYIIMQDVDRYNDAEYTTAAAAEEAMLAIGDIKMWVGRVERINDQLEIMFVCGEGRGFYFGTISATGPISST